MKEYIVTYYENTSIYYAQYHNHKEISAWAGLVLHLLFCQLNFQISFNKDILLIGTFTSSIFTLIVAFLVFLYIKNQLLMKDIAGAHTAASKILLSEVIQTSEEIIDVNKYMKIEDSADTQSQASHVLPMILLKKSEIINSRGRGFQDKTKWMIYSLLIFSTFSTIGYKILILL